VVPNEGRQGISWAAVDEMGCSIFGQLNGVKVHKMRWLGNVSVDKEYCSMVVYLDTKKRLMSSS
jgi:hypothetical protein